jgi:hypothetical protein
MESCQYRGYQIETRHEWSSWCVSVYRTRPDIPILPQPTWHISTPRKDDAVAEHRPHPVKTQLLTRFIGSARPDLGFGAFAT